MTRKAHETRLQQYMKGLVTVRVEEKETDKMSTNGWFWLNVLGKKARTLFTVPSSWFNQCMRVLKRSHT